MFEAYRLLSTLVLGAGAFLQIREYRSNLILDLADHYILICNHILMISVLIGGWVMQVVYFSVLGTHTYIGFIICSYSKHNPGSDNLFNIMLLNGCLLSYFLLKVYTQKSNLFGVGESICGETYLGVAESLDGWNCTYIEFWVFSLCWLLEQLYSIYIDYSITQQEPEVDHQWKKHFIKKKVFPTLLFLSVTLGYNLYSYLEVDSPTECMLFWVGQNFLQKMGIQIYKILSYIGPSAATLMFYYSTIPLFKRAPGSYEANQPLMLT